MRVLIVEDEVSLAAVMGRRLSSENYSVDICHDGNDVSHYIHNAEYDCIILDIMLPGKNGLEILRDLRETKISIPVIILTAKDSTSDRVVGLDSGADDYMIKPFAFDELLARVRAVIRRQNRSDSNELVLADLVLDISARTVSRGGKRIELTSKEYAVLECLMFNKDKTMTREQLISHIWNYDFNGSSNIVDVYIRYLRKKIDEDSDIKLIHTLRGSGYVMREN